MRKKKNNISRRKFIHQAGIAGLGLTTFSSSLFQFNALKAAALNSSTALAGDYKALVCIFLSGGSDSYNMLIPRDNSSYQDYSTTRSNLAIAQQNIRAINPLAGDGRDYGVNPSMSGVQQLFNSGRLSFISNIGSMVEPVTKQSYQNDSVELPLGLFSHSDQIKHWQTAIPHKRVSDGWGGRLAELLQDTNSNEAISMNISLSGTNVFQHGKNILEFTVDPVNGANGISGYKGQYGFNPARTELIDSMLSYQYEDIYKQTYINTVKQSVDAQEQFQAAIEGVPDISTNFSDNTVSDSFRMIARIIAARETLGFKKQIFFIQYGGWDHHDNLIDNQSGKLSVLSNAMREFADALEEIDMFENVVTATMSEFGRTLTSNGNGSDHAWGGNVMAMGGPVRGQRIFGDYPSLALGHELDLGRGRMIPTLANDLYFAELALWFGVSPSDLPMIFPNIGNFYDVQSGDSPIGFII